ncbi:MAG: hypothetical protein IE909_15190 [Campylobacterales bacterium]|nr:hypothetical protein [Campylobacterales bacterium]
MAAPIFASPYSCDPYSMQYGYECNTEVVATVESTTVNEVLTNTGRMDLANDSSSKAAATGQFIYAGNIKVINLPLGYNVTENIGLEAGVPVVSVSDFGVTKEDNMGLGDISVGANYHFGNYGSGSGLNVTTLRYKSSTGDEKKGLGLGKDSYTLSHAFAKEMGFVRAHASLSYTLNDDTVLGNSYNLMVGASRPCLLSDTVRTNAKLTYFNIDEVKKNGATWVSGFRTMDFWLEWNSDKLVSGVPLGLGLKIPLINEIEANGITADADKVFLVYLSASSLFK